MIEFFFTFCCTIDTSIITYVSMVVHLIGVYLVLKDAFYKNNSYILNSDIGEGEDGALLCFTDLFPCCDSGSGSAVGEWFFPDESQVPPAGTRGDFYRDRGPGMVRLHRRNNATSPTGWFCCEVPNAIFINIRICANIG